jgi:hypothetical protein
MVRLKSVPKLANLTLSFYSDVEDLAEWSSIELALGITAACLATMRPLLRRVIEYTRSMKSDWSSSPASRNTAYSAHGPSAASNRKNSVPLAETDKHWNEMEDMVFITTADHSRT